MKKSLLKVALAIVAFLLLTSNLNAQKMKQNNSKTINEYSDEELIKKLPGFKNHYEKVNGIQLHYVERGSGDALICLAGWPQTWYSFHQSPPRTCPKSAHTIGQRKNVHEIGVESVGEADGQTSAC